MQQKSGDTIKTTGQLRAMLGRMLAGVEAGTVTPETAAAACKVAATINQSFAEETKAVLAAKELGNLKIAFGYTEIGEPEAKDKPKQIETTKPDRQLGNGKTLPPVIGRVQDD